MSSLLPAPCVVAALRLIRGLDVTPANEDALFDELGCVTRDQALARLSMMLLGKGFDTGNHGARVRMIDATLTDMLREHVRRRQEARDRMAA